MAFPRLAHDPRNRRGAVTLISLIGPRWVYYLELHGFTNSHRIFVVDMDVFIILSRRFFFYSPFFAVVGFQDVLDSFVSVYESCWVIEI